MLRVIVGDNIKFSNYLLAICHSFVWILPCWLVHKGLIEFLLGCYKVTLPFTGTVVCEHSNFKEKPHEVESIGTWQPTITLYTHILNSVNFNFNFIMCQKKNNSQMFS